MNLSPIRRHEVVHATEAVMVGEADKIDYVSVDHRTGDGGCNVLLSEITDPMRAQMIALAPWVDNPHAWYSPADARIALKLGWRTMKRAAAQVRIELRTPEFSAIARALDDAMNEHNDLLFGDALEEVLSTLR